MARSKIALNDFLARHCRIYPSPRSADDEEYYLLQASDGKLYMTESHLREIWRAVEQKNSADDEGISVIKADGLDVGIKQIKIPLKLIESLTEPQAFLILRNFEGIQKDIEEGRLFKDRLEALFQDTASIRITQNENGERVYAIVGKISGNDQRRYMERYAEQVASRTLFDVAKALNGKLSQYVPNDMRGKHFIEGRDFSDRKIRYGEDVHTELALCDEGAWAYTTLAARNPQLRETITKFLQQAMTDPFGLSMTHYMGKHNVLKAGKRPLVKVPSISLFFTWVKGLFVKKAS